MTPIKSILATGIALAALSSPFTAGAQQTVPAPATYVPVAESITVADYMALLKSYDKTLFASGKAELTAQGAQDLDGLAAALRTVDYRIINIAGHADPTGSEPYNAVLASRRANAVRAHLIKRGINAARIFADATPIVAFGQCVDTTGAVLQECLAADRSADVKVLAKAVVEVREINTIFDRVEPVSGL